MPDMRRLSGFNVKCRFLIHLIVSKHHRYHRPGCLLILSTGQIPFSASKLARTFNQPSDSQQSIHEGFRKDPASNFSRIRRYHLGGQFKCVLIVD